MAARGPGHPAEARRLAEQAVAEHNANHKGERRAPMTQGPPKTTHPARDSRPQREGPHYAEGEFDPAAQARRRRDG